MDNSREHQGVLLEERRRRVASWLTERVRPAAHALAELAEDAARPNEREVREYQLDAWGNLWDARQEGKKRALVHLATGLGKTFVAVCDVMKFREEWSTTHRDGATPRVLFVSHKSELSEQAAEDFLSVMPNLDIDIFETQREGLSQDVDIRFATFQAILSEKYKFNPQDYEYIIYDEAHHTEAETFREIRDYFDPLFELALTATPRRMDEQDITEYFGAPVYSKDLPEAMAEGLLADVEYHIMLDDAVRGAIESGFDPKTLQELYQLMRITPRNEKIAEHIREEQRKQGERAKTIVFCQDVAHANIMTEELNKDTAEDEQIAVAYHSKMPKKVRRQILRDFRSGKIRTVCTRDMFNEGVNIPDATILAFTRMTGSEAIYFQQLGRGLRGKNKKVTVLDFVANVERIARLRALSEAVRRHAEKIGEETQESLGGQGGDIGLQVQTSHAEFNFDKLVIDLLDKFESIYAEAPEGWVSLNEFAQELNVDTRRVLMLLTDGLQVDSLPLYRFKGQSQKGYAISPQQQTYLRGLPELQIKGAPDGVVSIPQFAEQLGVSTSTIVNVVGEAGIILPLYKFGTKTGRGLDATAQKKVRTSLAEMFEAPEADTSVVSVSAFATRIGTSKPILLGILEKHAIEPETYRFNGQLAQGLNTNQQAQIIALPEIAKRPPEGTISVNAFAKQLGIAFTTLKNAIAKNGIELPVFKFGPKVSEGLDEAARVQVKEISGLLIEPAPDGVLSVKAFALSTGVHKRKVTRYLEERGIELPQYRFKTRATGGINQALQQQIKRDLQL